MKTIVVCDDVEIERLLLKEILCQYFEEINEEVSIVEYDSGETLIADVEEGYVAMDLLFLDICMKKLNGMETARKLRQIQCKVPIIFLTASPDYAIESYEVQASGYLLKSFSEEKLMKLLNRILNGYEKACCNQKQKNSTVIHVQMISCILTAINIMSPCICQMVPKL